MHTTCMDAENFNFSYCNDHIIKWIFLSISLVSLESLTMLKVVDNIDKHDLCIAVRIAIINGFRVIFPYPTRVVIM